MELILKTKTPIWSGDADGKTTKIRETAILGSLRWWTDAVLRAMGYYVCDTTSDKKCPNKDECYCTSCLIFGATGFRRIFRLEIEGGAPVYKRSLRFTPDDRNTGWTLGAGIIGDLNLKIIPLHRSFDPVLITLPLYIASVYGGIGAKLQHGYGVVEIDQLIEGYKLEELIIKYKKAIDKMHDVQGVNIITGDVEWVYPNLNDFFFLKFNFETDNEEWWKSINGIRKNTSKDRNGLEDDDDLLKLVKLSSVPIAPAIKDWLRYGNGKSLWENPKAPPFVSRFLDYFLFGSIKTYLCPNCFSKTIDDNKNNENRYCKKCKESINSKKCINKLASKVHISNAYPINDKGTWEFRIWGYLPNHREIRFIKSNFTTNLVDEINSNNKILFGNKIKNLTLNENKTINLVR